MEKDRAMEIEEAREAEEQFTVAFIQNIDSPLQVVAFKILEIMFERKLNFFSSNFPTLIAQKWRVRLDSSVLQKHSC